MAEETLAPFSRSPEYVPLCQGILERSESPYAQMVAALSLGRVCSEGRLTPPQRASVRAAALRCLEARGESFAPFVSAALAAALASLARCAEAEAGEARQARAGTAPDEARAAARVAAEQGWAALLLDAAAICDIGGAAGSEAKVAVGLKLARAVVQEASAAPPQGAPALGARHRRASVACRDGPLLLAFRLAVGVLAGVCPWGTGGAAWRVGESGDGGGGAGAPSGGAFAVSQAGSSDPACSEGLFLSLFEAKETYGPHGGASALAASSTSPSAAFSAVPFATSSAARAALSPRLLHSSRAIEEALELALAALSFPFSFSPLEDSAGDAEAAALQLPGPWRPAVECGRVVELLAYVAGCRSHGVGATDDGPGADATGPGAGAAAAGPGGYPVTVGASGIGPVSLAGHPAPPLPPPPPTAAASALACECLARLAGTRRSLYSSDARRVECVSRFLAVSLAIMQRQSLVGEHKVYLSVCRLLGRLKVGCQLGDLAAAGELRVPQTPTGLPPASPGAPPPSPSPVSLDAWLETVKAMTVASLRSWAWAGPGVGILLRLWARLASAAPYSAVALPPSAPLSTAPPAARAAAAIERHVADVAEAYLASRADAARVSARGGEAGDEDEDEGYGDGEDDDEDGGGEDEGRAGRDAAGERGDAIDRSGGWVAPGASGGGPQGAFGRGAPGGAPGDAPGGPSGRSPDAALPSPGIFGPGDRDVAAPSGSSADRTQPSTPPPLGSAAKQLRRRGIKLSPSGFSSASLPASSASDAFEDPLELEETSLGDELESLPPIFRLAGGGAVQTLVRELDARLAEFCVAGAARLVFLSQTGKLDMGAFTGSLAEAAQRDPGAAASGPRERPGVANDPFAFLTPYEPPYPPATPRLRALADAARRHLGGLLDRTGLSYEAAIRLSDRTSPERRLADARAAWAMRVAAAVVRGRAGAAAGPGGAAAAEAADGELAVRAIAVAREAFGVEGGAFGLEVAGVEGRIFGEGARDDAGVAQAPRPETPLQSAGASAFRDTLASPSDMDETQATSPQMHVSPEQGGRADTWSPTPTPSRAPEAFAFGAAAAARPAARATATVERIDAASRRVARALRASGALGATAPPSSSPNAPSSSPPPAVPSPCYVHARTRASRRVQLACLSFFESFRRAYVGEQAPSSGEAAYAVLRRRLPGADGSRGVLSEALACVQAALQRPRAHPRVVDRSVLLLSDLARGHLSAKVLLALPAVRDLLDGAGWTSFACLQGRREVRGGSTTSSRCASVPGSRPGSAFGDRAATGELSEGAFAGLAAGAGPGVLAAPPLSRSRLCCLPRIAPCSASTHVALFETLGRLAFAGAGDGARQTTRVATLVRELDVELHALGGVLEAAVRAELGDGAVDERDAAVIAPRAALWNDGRDGRAWDDGRDDGPRSWGDGARKRRERADARADALRSLQSGCRVVVVDDGHRGELSSFGRAPKAPWSLASRRDGAAQGAPDGSPEPGSRKRPGGDAEESRGNQSRGAEDSRGHRNRNALDGASDDPLPPCAPSELFGVALGSSGLPTVLGDARGDGPLAGSGAAPPCFSSPNAIGMGALVRSMRRLQAVGEEGAAVEEAAGGTVAGLREEARPELVAPSFAFAASPPPWLFASARPALSPVRFEALLRELRGILASAPDRGAMGVLLRWLLPRHLGTLRLALAALRDRPRVFCQGVKLFAEVALNRQQRLSLGAASAGGALVARELAWVLRLALDRDLEASGDADGGGDGAVRAEAGDAAKRSRQAPTPSSAASGAIATLASSSTARWPRRRSLDPWRDRFKASAAALTLAQRMLVGAYVPQASMALYGDASVPGAVDAALRLALAPRTPLPEVACYPKLVRAALQMLDAALPAQGRALAALGPAAWARAVDLLLLGLASPDAPAASAAAGALEGLAEWCLEVVEAARTHEEREAIASGRRAARGGADEGPLPTSPSPLSDPLRASSGFGPSRLHAAPPSISPSLVDALQPGSRVDWLPGGGVAPPAWCPGAADPLALTPLGPCTPRPSALCVSCARRLASSPTLLPRCLRFLLQASLSDEGAPQWSHGRALLPLCLLHPSGVETLVRSALERLAPERRPAAQVAVERMLSCLGESGALTSRRRDGFSHALAALRAQLAGGGGG